MNSTVEAMIGSADAGTLKGVLPVSGGSINDAFRVETNRGMFFLKMNSASRYPGMFDAEARGLGLLSVSGFAVPEPIATGLVGEHQFILMQWMEKGGPGSDLWSLFGTALARMHRETAQDFGLDHDNYIGSLPQSNTEHTTWADLYREARLIPQMELAERSGRLSSRLKRGFDALFNQLDGLFPVEKPALLHGDLWSGNMMVGPAGTPCIFDPAVYYGHREMDLAMMALFGGFGHDWVESYNEVYPLEPGWKQRIPIGQLYPLMVHVNLFGGGYARSVENVLQNYL